MTTWNLLSLNKGEKLFFTVFLLVLLTTAQVFGQTCPANGTFTPTNVTGTGNPKDWFNAGAWASGGIAGSDNGTTVTLSSSSIVVIENSDFNLAGRNLVVPSGTILFINGKLSLDAGQSITIAAGAILCCATPCNNSDKIRIGNTEIWDGSDGDIPGPATSNGGPLPVELLYFNAKSNGSNVILKWATATERNAEFFAVEKSLNGNDFIEIGREPASGNSIFRVDYSFVDDKALLGRAYYRLRQVDYNGSFQYFNITFADTEGSKTVSVYPNPVKDNQLKIYLNWTTEDVVNAKIYNSAGMAVNTFSFKGTEYSGENNLRSGTYILKIKVGNNHFTNRFVIQ